MTHGRYDMTITITWEGLLLTALALAGAVLLIYLIVVLPLSIVAASKVKALLSHRL